MEVHLTRFMSFGRLPNRLINKHGIEFKIQRESKERETSNGVEKISLVPLFIIVIIS